MAKSIVELTQIQAAIVAQEKLRGVVEDSVIDATIVALRRRQDELQTAGLAELRKLVTILFMDIVGSTIIVRDLDPEESLDIMDTALSRLTQPIEKHNGRVTRYLGDGFKAVFGLPVAHENDAEMAVRASLALLEEADAYAIELAEEQEIRNFQVRVGINTGWVAAGGGSEAERTIVSATINLAARLESAAEPGTVLISGSTYKHVRGAFDVEAQEAVVAKGFAEPVPAYRVLAARAHTFRMGRRGIEGVETRMVGRDHELSMLEEAYKDALEAAETRVITILGEAGVGKSRLLYEFENWLNSRPETISYYKGRAVSNLQGVPYSLFRDLFAWRFDIRENDNAAVAREKFRAGMAGPLPPERADIVGHWLGFDFSASEAVGQLRGRAEFADIAQTHLTRYFRAVAAREPVVILLEDTHCADDNSLDLLCHLVETIAQSHSLIVAVARLTLFERRPHWGEGQTAFLHLELRPLSRRASSLLMKEVLKRMDDIPATLGNMIVDTAEGNQLYVEELVKMFIDQGVIDKQHERWYVMAERLESLHVPSTLTGLLQARLDSLPQAEREVLQHAAVIGQLFWDDAVATLFEMPRAEAQSILEAIRQRELIFRHERSTFAGSIEYIFKHKLLRDVAYETVLLKQRRKLHGRVARWLEASAGDRLDENFGLIAEQYELAGEPIKAADFFGQASESAQARFILHEIVANAQRGVDLLAEVDDPHVKPARWRQDLILSKALVRKGSARKALEILDPQLPAVRHHGESLLTLRWLQALLSAVTALGDYERGQILGRELLALARQMDDTQVLMEVLLSLGHLGWQTDDVQGSLPYVQEYLELAQILGDRQAIGEATMILAFHAELVDEDLAKALDLHRQIETIARETGDIFLLMRTLNNLGYTLQGMGKYRAALALYEEALVMERDVGWDMGVSYTACRMAMTLTELGDVPGARIYLKEGLELAVATARAQTLLYGLFAHALLRIKARETVAGIELVGLAQAHPGYVVLDHGHDAEHILAQAREELSEAELRAALKRGAEMDFDIAVAELLSGA